MVTYTDKSLLIIGFIPVSCVKHTPDRPPKQGTVAPRCLTSNNSVKLHVLISMSPAYSTRLTAISVKCVVTPHRLVGYTAARKTTTAFFLSQTLLFRDQKTAIAL